MKRISAKAWREYVDAHARIRTTARDELIAFFDSLPWETDRPGAVRLLVDKAIEIANLYGLADATLSAGFYDELMLSYGVSLPPAEIVTSPAAFVSDDVLSPRLPQTPVDYVLVGFYHPEDVPVCRM